MPKLLLSGKQKFSVKQLCTCMAHSDVGEALNYL